MEKQFIPYKLALKLKELGFDEECFGWWAWINGDIAKYYPYLCSNGKLIELNTHPNNCSAPLWQQAFGWLMDDTIPEEYSLQYDIGGWTLSVEGKCIYYDNEKALEKLIKLREKYIK